jgi:uncharacterized protein (DUF302 family)
MIGRPDLALDLPLRLLIRQTDHRVELVSTGPSTAARASIPYEPTECAGRS